MKKISLIILPILTTVLELLPYGAVCIFATSPTDRIKETFSYFSLLPFGYANFAPFITAILTIAILLLALITIKKLNICKAVFVVSIIATIVSVLPLVYGVEYYSTIGCIISITLAIECVLAKSSMRDIL